MCLPFGTSISCAIFEQIGTLLQWLAKWKAGYNILHYLDNFFTAHKVKFVCDQIMTAVHKSCHDVGVTMAPEKRVWATQIIEFLGLIFDTILMIVQIPQDKIDDIRSHLVALKSATKAHAKSLKSLAGKLNFISKVFLMGRPFIQCIYDQAAGVPNNQIVSITAEVLADINMQFQFLKSCKGWLLIVDNQQRKKQTLSVFTDASANPNLGWGVYTSIMGWWSYGQWDSLFFEQFNPSIDFLEMYTILIFLDNKCDQLANYNLQFYSDNMPTVETLSCRTSRSKQLMIIIQAITLICLHHNIKFTISHIKGKFNIHADKLSHLQLQDFKSAVNNVDQLDYWNPQGWVWPLSISMLNNLSN